MAGLVVADLISMRNKVEDWADTSAVTDPVLSDFINMAVGKLSNILRVRAMESTVVLPFTTNELTLPADYIQTKYLKVVVDSGDVYLERKSIDKIDEYATRDSGIPCYFGRDVGVLRVAPMPNEVTEATLCYYVEPPALVADGDTNWFITDASQAVLFGALWELGSYTQDLEFADTYKSRFVEEAQELQAKEDKENWSGDVLSVM